MGNFYDKTNYLLETKSLLKDRINSLGGSIISGTTFRDYLVWLDSLYEALDEKIITGLPDSLEGKCEQEGTPTPSSPVPINITTGRQVVRVCGKNILKLIRDNETGGSYDSETDTYSSTTRIGTAVWYFKTLATSHSYTFSTQSTTNAEYLYCFSNNDLSVGSDIVTLTYNSGGNITGDNRTVYNNSNLKYLYVTFRTSTTNVNATLEKPMLESGPTATTYEEYKGNDYEINLGKNIANPSNIYMQNGINESGNMYFANTRVAVYKIPVKPNTQYSLSCANGYQMGNIFQYDSSGTFSNIISSSYSSSKQYTSSSTTYYISFVLKNDNNTTIDVSEKDILNVQIEKGSASSFSPYKTPIYLGEIGNYKDYIFRNTTENPLYDSNLEEGQWYIHKEIGRVVLNGASSESWSILNVSTKCYKLSNFENGNTTDQQTNFPMLSSHFLSTKQVLVYNGTIGIQALGGTTKALYICFGSSSSIGDVSALRTWLSTHNVEVYYVLNTPTTILIEDEELINQLNEIEIFTVISEDFYN